MAKRGTWNPNTADWLVKQRGSRTQDSVIADMAARGVKVKRAWLSRIENGAPFSDELLAAFRDYYGSEPPAYEPATETGDPSLASALSELAAELRWTRQEREGLEARLRAMEADIRSLRARPADEASPARSVPQRTTG